MLGQKGFLEVYASSTLPTSASALLLGKAAVIEIRNWQKFTYQHQDQPNI